ncbi:O-antigen ligase family protein [Campylobacter sp. faydin G-140]|uniref:O-antigen ligase family protein n=1 Tax=Campylobacter anatolicus TaxID=2829105 RepID=UPI001BA12F3A|nr:O-antigen ligase family protein [Campylobacter anatolicus]MBR8465220.1 O-antigen ligase family protein [Campylobacter anatolicus]
MNTTRIKEYFNKPWQILLYKFLLFTWVVSIPFKNVVYQISFVLLDLFFIAHVIYHRNFSCIKEILSNVKFIAICFCGVILSLIISNALNTEFISQKAWSNTALFVFRTGLIFIALGYFYRLKFFSIDEIIFALLAGLSLVGLTAIVAIGQDPSIIFNVTDGLTGSLSSRTIFGLFAGLGLVSSFVLVKNKAIKSSLIFIFLFLTIFSFARSSWVASGVAISVFIILNFKNIGKKELITVTTLVLFVVILYLSFDSFQQRVSALINLNSSGRFTIWTYSIQMIQQSPIFGYGLDSFRYLPNTPALQRTDFNATHNIILELLLYTGVFGAIFYLSLIFATFLKAYKSQNFAIFTLFTYMFVLCLFDFGAYSKEPQSIITIFIFLLYAHKFKE